MLTQHESQRMSSVIGALVLASLSMYVPDNFRWKSLHVASGLFWTVALLMHVPGHLFASRPNFSTCPEKMAAITTSTSKPSAATIITVMGSPWPFMNDIANVALFKLFVENSD